MDLQNDLKPKSFWSRPEGTTGMFVMVILGIAAVMGFGSILPWIITLLQNTLHAALLFAAVGAIAFVASDRRFRTLLSYAYKSTMRAITGIFVTIDPIGILKGYIDDLKEQLANMDAQIDRLDGEITKLDIVIKGNEKQRQKDLEVLQQAQMTGKDDAAILRSRSAGRLEESNKSLQELHDRMQALYMVLCRMRKIANNVLLDLISTVDLREREYKAMTEGYSAYKSAKKIINGSGEEKELFERALEHLADEYGSKLGEMKSFMEQSKGMLEDYDLQDSAARQKAYDAVERWNKRSKELLLSSPTKSSAIEVGQVRDLDQGDQGLGKTIHNGQGNKFDLF